LRVLRRRVWRRPPSDCEYEGRGKGGKRERGTVEAEKLSLFGWMSLVRGRKRERGERERH